MEGQPPRGPEGGEPFPTFDPDERSAVTRPKTPRTSAPPQASPWLVGLAVAAVTVTISIIAFGLFASGPTTGTTVPGTAAPGNGEDTTGDDTIDTSDPGDGDAPGVTAPGGAAQPVTAIGDPIPISDLTMQANGIGQFQFGTDGDQVLGRFAATFGPPTDDTGFRVGDGSWGECGGDSIRVVRWGPLNLVVRGEPTSNTFISYRMDLRYGGATSDITDMRTLSGLRVYDTNTELQSIYSDLDIVYRVHPTLDTIFELRASPQGDLLLWGPVESQADNSLVTGIYSPDACRPTSS